MKAVLQNFKTGELAIEDVPPPSLKPGGVLVANVASLVSAGTEKAIIELAKMNPLQKARARPDLVKKVLNKAGQEGLLATARIVMNLVSTPLPLGYSCAGVVTAVGSRVADLSTGQRVACAGLGYANHAELVYVPRNLVVPVPEAVGFEDASFVTVGAIAMHGVRQAALTLGESVVVIGMGLVGQIAAQIVHASGCRVFCVDPDPGKVELALRLGADAASSNAGSALHAEVMSFTASRGADAVLIAASTKSSEPIETAAEVARDRARVVAIGDVGHSVPRRAYYEKEIDLRQSRSYGPGRYDPDYEEKGQDYPIGYVRWTENRNMEAFLALVERGSIQLRPLITHRYSIERADEAYTLLSGERKEPYVGIVIDYENAAEHGSSVPVASSPKSLGAGEISIGVIGAGQFAQGILLPALKAIAGVRFKSVATESGLTSLNVARKYRAESCTSDYHDVLNDASIDAVVVATRHDSHAAIVAAALRAGKHCFVEKPLAMNESELEDVIDAHRTGNAGLLVGFNRRFSPLSVQLRERLSGQRLVMQYRINAGPVPRSHWHQDLEYGGGRIIGEVCHFIDVMQYCCASEPLSVQALAVTDSNSPSDPDNVVIQVAFADGSVGTITYVSNGDPDFPKERLEAFGGGFVAVIDNWRSLDVQGNGTRLRRRCWLQAEKGHSQEMSAFIEGIRSGEPPIPFSSLVSTTRTTFAIQQALRSGACVSIA